MQRPQREVTFALALSALLVVSMAVPAVAALDAGAPATFQTNAEEPTVANSNVNVSALDAGPIDVEQSYEVSATVTNAGANATNATVEYRIGGASVAGTNVSISGYGSEAVTLAAVPSAQVVAEAVDAATDDATSGDDATAADATSDTETISHGVYVAPANDTDATLANATTDSSLASLTGVVEGTVTDASTGHPVANATVTAEARSGTNATTVVAETNGTGAYRFENVSPGLHDLTVAADGYETNDSVSVPVAGQTASGDVALDSAGANFTVSSFESPEFAAPGLEILPSATVTNDGQGAANQTVTYSVGDDVLWSTAVQLEPGASATVDAHVGLPADVAAGNYTQAIATPQHDQTAPFEIRTDSGALEGWVLEDSVENPREIVDALRRGEAVDDAALVADATVSVDEADVEPTATDENGSFLFERVPAPARPVEQNYTVRVEHDDYQTATASFPLSAGFRMQDHVLVAAEQNGSVAGTITDNATATGLDGATVTVRDADGVVTRTTQTDENGSYVVPDVEPGNYTVTANATRYQNGVTGVTVAANETTTADVGLDPETGSISGTITSAESSAGLGDASLRLVHSEEILTTTTEADGSYTFEDVPTGDSVLEVNAQGYAGNQTEVTVGANESLEESLALERERGTIAGEVTAPDGSPIEGATVDVQDAGAEYGQTNQTGAYEIASVPTGSYNLSVSADGYGTNSTAVEVTSEETVTQDVVLEPLDVTVSVSNLDVTEEAEQADTIEVAADVTNEGERTVDRTVRYVLEDAAGESTELASDGITIDSGATEQVTLTGQLPATIDPGEYTHGIFTADDTATTGLTILEPATVEIPAVLASDQIYSGEPLQVTTTVTNTGEVDASETVTLAVEGDSVDSQTVDLSAGESDTVDLFWNETAEQTGTVDFTVTAATDSGTGTVEVEQPTGALEVDPRAYDNTTLEDATISVLDGDQEVANVTGEAVTGYGFEVPVGENYTVRVSAPDYQTTTLSGVDVALDQTASRTVFLDPVSGSISGNVTSEAGFDSALVTLLPDGSTKSADDGTYAFENVTPGDYTLIFGATNHDDAERTISIGPNETETVDVNLDPSLVTIEGIVSSNATDDGIENVEVSVQSLDTTSTTNEDGSYTIEAVTPGEYTLEATATGYRTGQTEIDVVANESAVANLTLSRERGAIAGEVTAPDGTPIEGATVDVEGADVESGPTNESGAYEITSVPTDTYELSVSAAGYAGNDSTSVDVSANQTATQDVLLDPQDVHLSVTDFQSPQSALPGEQIVVSANVTNEGARSENRTITLDIDGASANSTSVTIGPTETERVGFEYAISEDADPGNYTFGIDSGDDSETGDLSIPEPSNVSIVAVVGSDHIYSGEPLQVSTTLTNTGEVNASENVTLAVEGEAVDSQIVDLPAGESDTVDLSWNETAAHAGTVDFTVTAATDSGTETVEVEQPTGTLEVDPRAYDNTTLEDATISVLDGDQEVANVTGEAVTGYGFEVPVGENYTVRVSAPDYQTTTLSGVDVALDQTVSRNVSLDPILGTITGNVTSEFGFDSALVTLQPDGPTESADDGTYTIENVTPGEYTLIFGATDHDDAERTISIGPNETETVDVNLDPLLGTIEGTVSSNETQEELADVEVSIESPTVDATTTTDEDGQFVFDGLDPGEYDIDVEPENYEWTRHSVSVGPDDEVSPEIAVDPRPGVVGGTVTTDSGTPIDGATVTLDAPGVDGTVTSISGNYVFEDVPTPGEYSLTVNATDFVQQPVNVTVGPNQEVEHDFTLEPLPEAATYYVWSLQQPDHVTPNETFTVGVDVHNPGQVDGNKTVEYRIDDETIAEETVAIEARGDTTLTFELDASDLNASDIDPGRYESGFFTPSHSQTAELVVVPEEGWTISGNVTDSYEEEPVENATVSVDAADVGPVQTDENGTYAIEDVPLPGEYTLSVEGEKYHRDASREAELEFGSTPVVDVPLDRPEQYLGVDRIDAPGSVDEGDSVDVTANVTNYGTGQLDNATVTLLVNGSSVGKERITLNETGESRLVEFTHEADVTGARTLAIQTSNATLTQELQVEADSDDGSDFGGGGGPGSIGGPSPSPSPSDEADLSVLSAEAAETSIEPGDTVRVDVTVQNQGDAEGTMDVELTTDGRTLDSGSVTVPAGSNVGTELSATFDDAGTYDLAVEDEDAGSVQVGNGSATGENEPGFEEEEVVDGESDDGQPGFGPIAALAALLVGALYAAGRSSAGRE